MGYLAQLSNGTRGRAAHDEQFGVGAVPQWDVMESGAGTVDARARTVGRNEKLASAAAGFVAVGAAIGLYKAIAALVPYVELTIDPPENYDWLLVGVAYFVVIGTAAYRSASNLLSWRVDFADKHRKSCVRRSDKAGLLTNSLRVMTCAGWAMSLTGWIMFGYLAGASTPDASSSLLGVAVLTPLLLSGWVWVSRGVCAHADEKADTPLLRWAGVNNCMDRVYCKRQARDCPDGTPAETSQEPHWAYWCHRRKAAAVLFAASLFMVFVLAGSP